MGKHQPITSFGKDGSQPVTSQLFAVTKTPSPSDEAATDNIAELVKALLDIDLNSPLAKLNETTMSDNNGGRIEL